MARNDPQMNLRVPVELKEKIERAAFENNRTITAEAVARLEESFRLEIGLKDGILISKTGMDVIESTMYNMMFNVVKSLKEQGIDDGVIEKAVQTNMKE